AVDIKGPGTETSDSIPARLSRGESVMTAKATRMFKPMLSWMNQAGGGASFDFMPQAKFGYATGGLVSDGVAVSDDFEGRIADAVQSAIENAPPLRAYTVETDMTQAQKRVSTIENRARLR